MFYSFKKKYLLSLSLSLSLLKFVLLTTVTHSYTFKKDMSLGERVRVVQRSVDDDGKWYRVQATVMCVDEEGVIEVLKRKSFSNRGKCLSRNDKEEDMYLNVDKVEKLQDFETRKEKKEKAITLKEQGNVLFKLRDFETAEEYYMKAVRYEEPLVENDSVVYVVSRQTLLRCRVILTGKNMVDVRTSPIYSKKEEKPEYFSVRMRNIACVVPNSSESRGLRCALHKNIIRCCMHRKDFNAALWHANVAYALSLESPRNIENIIKVLCLRARVHLECALPRHAKLDVARAAALFDGDDLWHDNPSSKLDDLKRVASSCKNKQIRVLAKAIVKNMKSRIKTKRVLAKEFSVWLSDVSTSQSNTQYVIK